MEWQPTSAGFGGVSSSDCEEVKTPTLGAVADVFGGEEAAMKRRPCRLRSAA